MATLPLNLLNILNVVAPASSAQQDKGKNLDDGFQSLLSLGTNKDVEPVADKPKLEVKREENNDAVAAYLEVPKEIVDNARPVADTKDDIEVYIRDDKAASSDNTAKSDSKNSLEKVAAINNSQQKADTVTDGKEAEGSTVSDASVAVQSLSQGNAEETNVLQIQPIVKLINAITNVIGAKDNLQPQNLLALDDTLKNLSPDLLARLQVSLQNIQQVLQGEREIAGVEKNAIASIFGQIIATLNKPAPDAVKVADIGNLLDKLQAFVDLVAPKTAVAGPTGPLGGTDLTADNDNIETYASYKANSQGVQNAVAKSAEVVDVVTPQHNTAKQDNVGGAAVSTQVVAKASSGNTGSGFSDTGSGQRDGSSLVFGLARAPSQTAAAQADSASFSKMLQQTNSRPVLDQVTFHVKTAVETGSSKIHIQLNPAELGKLDIKLEVDADGKTGITVTADNKNTLDLLQRDSRGLERALSDAGLKSDSGSLSFNLRSDGQDRNQHEQSQAALNYKQSIPEEEPLALDLLTRSYVVNLADGLDIKI